MQVDISMVPNWLIKIKYDKTLTDKLKEIPVKSPQNWSSSVVFTTQLEGDADCGKIVQQLHIQLFGLLKPRQSHLGPPTRTR